MNSKSIAVVGTRLDAVEPALYALMSDTAYHWIEHPLKLYCKKKENVIPLLIANKDQSILRAVNLFKSFSS